MWEATTGKTLLTLDEVQAHTTGRLNLFFNRIESVAFSPDGRRIATGSQDATAKVWDAESGGKLLTLKGHTNWVSSVAFSPDGRRIVTGSLDQTAKVWDAITGKELFSLKGHGDGIASVAFSPDGRRIMTGSGDGTVRLWEATSGRELLVLKGGTFRSVAFSGDNLRIAAGIWGGTALVWEAASASQVATWLEEELTAANSLSALQRSGALELKPERTARASNLGDASKQTPAVAEAEATVREELRVALLAGTNDVARLAHKTMALTRQRARPDQQAQHDSLIEQALGVLEQSQSSAGGYYAMALDNELRVRERRGDFKGALKVCQQAYDNFKSMPGDHRNELAGALIGTASFLGRLGRSGEAEKVSREVLQLRTEQLGPDASLTLNAKMLLGLVLEGRGDGVGAEAAYREAAAGLLRCPDFAPDMADNATQALAFYLQQGNRQSEAEKVLLEGWDSLQTHTNSTPEVRQRAAKRILDFYQAWDAALPNTGKASQAADWKRRLSESNPSPSPNR